MRFRSLLICLQMLLPKRCSSVDRSTTLLFLFFSRDVIGQIKASDPSWTEHVPDEVAEVIRHRGLFGYKKPRLVKELVS